MIKMSIRRIFSKIIICLFGIALIIPGAIAADNLPGAAGGDVGDYGRWATDHNREVFTSTLSQDMDFFQSGFQNQQVADYVPIEAKVGLAFINGMALIGHVLDMSLIRFITIFILIAFTFWTGFEAYQMITGTLDVKKSVENIVKKGFMITVWLIIINAGPAKIFMWIMGPIITVGTYMADLILNAVTSVAGATLPDTCGAIREYAAANISGNAAIDAAAAADLMCLPTRMSGFFYTSIAAGWKWMLAGIGSSAFTFFVGAVFIVVSLINLWKFALMAMGVIADLFLTIFLLPFTAIAETVGKTSYKGIAGTVFNGFLSLFKPASLSSQIGRFINAAIFFVSLAMVIALCTALLSGVIDANLAASVPSLDNQDFVITLLVVLLVGYLANKLKDIAGDIGGSVDDSIGQQLGKDITRLTQNAYKQGQKYWRAYRQSKKK